MNILEKLYYGDINPKQWKIKNDQPYTRAKNRSNQLYEELKHMLTENELHTLDHMLETRDIMSVRSNMHAFSKGFKMGMSFILEAME